MAFKSDLEIAQEARLSHINHIAEKLGIGEEELEHYGKYKAKLPLSLIDDEEVQKNNLILVTAITPTPSGEGKTTTSIGSRRNGRYQDEVVGVMAVTRMRLFF